MYTLNKYITYVYICIDVLEEVKIKIYIYKYLL